MHQRHIAWSLAAVAVTLAMTLALAACSGTPTGGSSGSPGPSPSPSGRPVSARGLILRVAYVGGFIAPNASRRQLPLVSVYDNGRIISEGATDALYPGPLLPSLVVRNVGAGAAAAILKAALDAGLAGADATYPPSPPPDAPSTVITVIHDGQQTVSTFGLLSPYSLQPGAGGSPPGPATERIRAASAALIARLMGSDTFGGPGGPTGAYVAGGYQLFVSPGGPTPADPQLARPPVAWPLAEPLGSFGQPDPLGGTGARTGNVIGPDSATLGPILAAATQITPFSSGGKLWTVVVRPLLPDEVAALGG